MNKYPPYKFLPELFLRAPYYSFVGYDLERVQEVLNDQAFKNGLFLASPGFYHVLEVKGFDLQKLSEKELHSVRKYYNRMCFRPTPFGSFASFTILTWGKGETVRLAGDDQAVLHLLPDAKLDKVTATGKSADNDHDLLIKNPTVYQLGPEYRFVRSDIDETGHYRFSLDAVPANEFYNPLFGFLNRPVKKTDLFCWLMDKSACTPAEAADFTGFLLEEQLLYEPATGHIISQRIEVAEGNPDKVVWSPYNPVNVKMSASLSQLARGQAPAVGASWLPEQGHCFYAGLERNLHSGGPCEQDQSEVAQAVELLRRLATPYMSSQLRNFIADFQARFDRQKVPLLTALDPDSGVSYGNFGISGLAKGFEDIRVQESLQKKEAPEWTGLHSWLFSRLSDARETGRYAPVVLTSAHFSDIEALVDPCLAPSTVAVMFRKTADHIVIEYTGGAAAASLVGRFSVFSETAAALCRKLAKLEAAEHPDVLFADIGQLSDEHTDNINRRLQIYPFEIPLNVYSALDSEMQLKPEDLTICVRNGQLILESVRHRKRVIPRLASAYNYKHNEFAIFRLLGDLQYQGLQANLNFNLERFFPGLKFYPRVVFGQTIVSLARWHFDQNEIWELRPQPHNEALSWLRSFRQRYCLPQKVTVGKFDQQLVFDLSSSEEAPFFLKFIKTVDDLVVTEYLMPDRSVKIGNKPFAGQYISFLHHNEKIYEESKIDFLQVGDKTERLFLPGSEWLYIKIYCTPASADRIIAEVLAPMVHNNASLLRKWFFIRYADNGYHLRLRFLAEDQYTGQLLRDLKNQLVISGHEVLVKNYQAEIYKREMERYAGIIEPVEDFFYAGSELMANYLQFCPTQEAPISEFFFGLYTAHHLIACFVDGIADVKEFLGQMAEAFIKKFTSNKELKKDMDMKYRSMRKEVEELFEGTLPLPELAGEFSRLLTTAKVIADKIVENEPERRDAILADLVHMQLNRTFSVKQRTHEFMVYFFLNKYAASRLARTIKES